MKGDEDFEKTPVFNDDGEFNEEIITAIKKALKVKIQKESPEEKEK